MLGSRSTSPKAGSRSTSPKASARAARGDSSIFGKFIDHDGKRSHCTQELVYFPLVLAAHRDVKQTSTRAHKAHATHAIGRPSRLT